MSSKFRSDALFDDIDNLDSSPDIAMQLGNMVAAWAYAEAALSRALSIVSGMPLNMAMRNYYRIPTFEARTKFILGLVEMWQPSAAFDRAAIHKCIEKITKLSTARNHWVHAIWSAEKSSGKVVTFHLRPDDEKERCKPVKAADIKNHNCSVRARSQKLYALLGLPT